MGPSLAFCIERWFPRGQHLFKEVTQLRNQMIHASSSDLALWTEQSEEIAFVTTPMLLKNSHRAIVHPRAFGDCELFLSGAHTLLGMSTQAGRYIIGRRFEQGMFNLGLRKLHAPKERSTRTQLNRETEPSPFAERSRRQHHPTHPRLLSHVGAGQYGKLHPPTAHHVSRGPSARASLCVPRRGEKKLPLGGGVHH